MASSLDSWGHVMILLHGSSGKRLEELESPDLLNLAPS